MLPAPQAYEASKTAEDMLKEDWAAFQPMSSESNNYRNETTLEAISSSKSPTKSTYKSTAMEPQVKSGTTPSTTSTTITLPTTEDSDRDGGNRARGLPRTPPSAYAVRAQTESKLARSLFN